MSHNSNLEYTQAHLTFALARARMAVQESDDPQLHAVVQMLESLITLLPKSD